MKDRVGALSRLSNATFRDEDIEQRIVIKFFQKWGKSHGETFEALSQVYGDRVMPKSLFYKRFNEFGGPLRPAPALPSPVGISVRHPLPSPAPPPADTSKPSARSMIRQASPVHPPFSGACFQYPAPPPPPAMPSPAQQKLDLSKKPEAPTSHNPRLALNEAIQKDNKLKSAVADTDKANVNNLRKNLLGEIGKFLEKNVLNGAPSQVCGKRVTPNSSFHEFSQFREEREDCTDAWPSRPAPAPLSSSIGHPDTPSSPPFSACEPFTRSMIRQAFPVPPSSFSGACVHHPAPPPPSPSASKPLAHSIIRKAPPVPQSLSGADVQYPAPLPPSPSASKPLAYSIIRKAPPVPQSFSGAYVQYPAPVPPFTQKNLDQPKKPEAPKMSHNPPLALNKAIQEDNKLKPVVVADTNKANVDDPRKNLLDQIGTFQKNKLKPVQPGTKPMNNAVLDDSFASILNRLRDAVGYDSADDTEAGDSCDDCWDAD